MANAVCSAAVSVAGTASGVTCGTEKLFTRGIRTPFTLVFQRFVKFFEIRYLFFGIFIGRKCACAASLIFHPIRSAVRCMSVSGVRFRLREIFTSVFTRVFASFLIQIFIHFLDPLKKSTEKPVFL